MQEIGKFEVKTDVIPNELEKRMAFTVNGNLVFFVLICSQGIAAILQINIAQKTGSVFKLVPKLYDKN